MENRITKDMILKFMRESLRKYKGNPHLTLITDVLINMSSSGLIASPEDKNYSNFYNDIAVNDSELTELLVECYTFLIIRGIIIPIPTAPNYGNYEAWNNYRLTEYGERWANIEVDPIPEDRSGFIQFINNNIKNIDVVIVQYISEAIETYNTGHIFASSVMVGAASEKAIYLLAEAMINAIQDPTSKAKLSNLFKFRKMSDLLEEISERIKIAIDRKIVPYEIHGGTNQFLFSLFDAIRIQRNDAVHPLGGRVNEEQLRLLLMSFPHVCKKVYDLIYWLKTNQIV